MNSNYWSSTSSLELLELDELLDELELELLLELDDELLDEELLDELLSSGGSSEEESGSGASLPEESSLQLPTG